MKRILHSIGICVFLLFAFTFFSSQKTLAAEYTSNGLEIVIDVSGSMNGIIDGKTKMNIAKEALSSTVSAIPENSYVGLRAYGHQGTVAEKNCTDTQLLVPISKINKSEIISKVNSLTPNGWTPIDYSLRQAKEDFSPEYGKVIILISDGEETCGGDPCATIKELKNAGFDAVVHTIGFDVGDVAEKQLQCIAEATGGQYKSAKNANELIESLKFFSVRAFEDYTTSGGADPGTGFNNAPLVTAGEYGGDFLMGESKFYKINVKKGQEIIAVASVRRESPAGTGSIQDYKCVCMKPGIKIFDKYKKELDSMIAEDCSMFQETTGILGTNLSPVSYDAQAVAPNTGEYYISISGSWQASCTTTSLNDSNPTKAASLENSKNPTAYYELTIGLEGAGEIDPIMPVEKILDENKTTSSATETNPLKETGRNNLLGLILTGSAVVMLVLVGVIIFILIRKRKNSNGFNQKTNNSAASQESAKPEDSQTPLNPEPIEPQKPDQNNTPEDKM